MLWIIQRSQTYSIYYSDSMKKIDCFTLFAFLITWSRCQDLHKVTYQILSEGEEIRVPLHNYFKSANDASLIQEKCTHDYEDVFKISRNNIPIQIITESEMAVNTSYGQVKFSEHSYYCSKSVYNQPIKIFLLDNNFLMMYIYKEHCADLQEGFKQSGEVLGLNLTEKLLQIEKKEPNPPSKANYSCTSMQVQTTTELDLLYVSCKKIPNVGPPSFIIVEINLVHDIKNYVIGMQVLNKTTLSNQTSKCEAFSLKYFSIMYINNLAIPNRIFGYCNQHFNKEQMFYFYTLNESIDYLNFSQLLKCTTGASYISPIDQAGNGFLSIIDGVVFEYYTNLTSQTKVNQTSKCTETNLRNIQYQFAATRQYDNIQMHYFFLKNNSLIIKSSYKTNHQVVEVGPRGYNFTSYALSQHFLGMTMNNGTHSKILVFNTDQLYPRQIDDQTFSNDTSLSSMVMTSLGNYLEKGFYFLHFNSATNQIGLDQYSGYLLSLQPSKLATQQQLNSTWIIVLQVYGQFLVLQEQLNITIILRIFNDPKTIYRQNATIGVKSQFMDVNLSSMAIGPLKKFYLQESLLDHNIDYFFINYQDKLDVQEYLEVNFTDKNGTNVTQKLKSFSINGENRASQPYITLYYEKNIQNCILGYNLEKKSVELSCKSDEKRLFRSDIPDQSRIIILSKEKWLQYNQSYIQLCTMSVDSGQCNTTNLRNSLPLSQQIEKVKLVKFQYHSNGTFKVQVFIMCENQLHYGYFLIKESLKKGSSCNFTSIFSITKNQVQSLESMAISNIHYDDNYEKYLLLHLSSHAGDTVRHKALLYDRPQSSNGDKFIGHLIGTFEDQQIKAILTIDDLLVIINRADETGQTRIIQYRVTDSYSVEKTRTYPLYGRKVVENGSHVSDGSFIYIEVEIANSKKTQYLVFCPSLSTPNILTHKFIRQSFINFVQVMGTNKSKYPHSLFIHGSNMMSLTIPNMILKFKNLEHMRRQTSSKEGTLKLALIDYLNTMHEVELNYTVDSCGEAISYTRPVEDSLILSKDNNDNNTQKKLEHELNPSLIIGPVMNYSLATTGNCDFLSKDIQDNDVITSMQCLLNINAKKYGKLLDFTSIQITIGKAIEIVVTTLNLICVEDKLIDNVIPFSTPKQACEIIRFESNQLFFVCDEDQKTVIKLLRIGESCSIAPDNLTTIERPSWLTYQYFHMKYVEPYVVLQVPIRYYFNKIYFICLFDEGNNTLSEKFRDIVHSGSQHFISKDFSMNSNYLFLLEDGLGIYDLEKMDWQDEDTENKEYEPVVWITRQVLQKSLNVTEEFVYAESIFVLEDGNNGHRDGDLFGRLPLEIGTLQQAFKIQIELFNNTDCYQCTTFQDLSYKITVMVNYKQYRDCYNHVRSRSKNWDATIIKLCTLDVQDKRIFSNFIPISESGVINYIQFYQEEYESEKLQTLYPFRMESIYTNDSFEIKPDQGELIVSSLFNFLCYFTLADQITWTFTTDLDEEPPQQTTTCTAVVSLKNQNSRASYSFDIVYEVRSNLWKPWIFRCFYTALLLVSAFKLWRYRNQRLRMHKGSTSNFYSHEFDLQVRLISKKQSSMVWKRTESENSLDQTKK